MQQFDLMRRNIIVLIFLAILCLSTSQSSSGQIRPVYDQGALGLAQLLKRLNTTASALMIGAHPDDEDTALLAYLARGEGARTAYLSLTRGDGGQNILGPELGESLGIIRTEELLQARKLDGAEQYFTRAYDYGFSKTLAEARQKWDEKVILCDVVRVIRSFRPLVVISQFSGTPADGHGHHQFAGYISPLAVKAAADPGQCPDAGPVWTVRKVYVRHRGQGEPTLRINTGKYDPLLGRSYFEIAMEARSQHKSQEQGVLELKGDQFSNLNLVESTVPRVAKESGIFEGLDIAVAGYAPALGSHLRNLGAGPGSSVQRSSALGNAPPQQDLSDLAESIVLIQKIETSAENGEIKEFALRKQQQLLSTISRVAGIQIDVLADRETTVTGESFSVTVNVFHPDSAGIRVSEILLSTPDRWKTETASPAAVPQSTFRREMPDSSKTFTVFPPADTEQTQPYWMTTRRGSDLFSWTADDFQTLPIEPAILSARIKIQVGEKQVTFQQPVEYRFADDVRGEVRRNLNVVPKLSINLDQNLLIVPRSSKPSTRELNVTVTNHASGPAAGEVRLNLPNGWKAEAVSPSFDLKRKGEKGSVKFVVAIPPNAAAGLHEIGAEAVSGSETFTRTMNTISYPHIQTHRYYTPAAAKVNVMDLAVEPVKIGYIEGSGDRVPEAIRRLGLSVEMLDETAVTSSDLSRFDVIVVGIRAYQVRPDVVANNQRLLDFAKNGGTLIVQYQLPPYAQQGLTPYPAQMGPRVADETAPVTILQPEHPLLNAPNKITQEDFKGWVQERNLYNFSTFDAKYTPLLESHDTGEAENKGGLVIADIGKGKYVYCSYSLFRQLPAGVPGAYRLLANLLSLPKVGGEK